MIVAMRDQRHVHDLREAKLPARRWAGDVDPFNRITGLLA
jgi:hypothetical protein